jgi:hypothetical protein
MVGRRMPAAIEQNESRDNRTSDGLDFVVSSVFGKIENKTEQSTVHPDNFFTLIDSRDAV